MGVPVVSTTHGGIPEMVLNGVTGLLVPERNYEALADALSLLLADRGPVAEPSSMRLCERIEAATSI